MFVVVVAGPPCSGKSSYVAEHAQPGDVVIDYDAIASAIGADGDTHDHHPVLHGITLHACDAIFRRALRDHHIAGIWLIRSKPRGSDLAMATELVVLDTPLEECYRRAVAADRPERVLELIEGWAGHAVAGS